MFRRIGRKIKGVVKILFWIEVAAIYIVGLVFIVPTSGLSILYAIGGILVAWISSWLIYGFGEIIDKLCDIEENTRGFGVILASQAGENVHGLEMVSEPQAGRISPEQALCELKEKLVSGQISQEEYHAQRAKITGKL